MNPPPATLAELVLTSKRFAHRMVAAGSNRLSLLAVELCQERERLLGVLLLGLSIGMLVLLASITFTAAVVALLWSVSPWVALTVPTACYAILAMALASRLRRILREWIILPSTTDQLRKDLECLENGLH